MATNEELEKRIEILEKEVQHLKAVLQYKMRNKKKWFILSCIAIISGLISISPGWFWVPHAIAKY